MRDFFAQGLNVQGGVPAPSGFGAYFMANPTTVHAKADTNTLPASTSGKKSPQLRFRQGARAGNNEIGVAIFM